MRHSCKRAPWINLAARAAAAVTVGRGGTSRGIREQAQQSLPNRPTIVVVVPPKIQNSRIRNAGAAARPEINL
jgi:hypothetical protein